MSLQITCDAEPEKKILIIHLDGMLNTETVKAFDKAITESKLQAVMYVVLELKALTYISSAGFRSVFKLTKFMQGRGGEVTVANRQPQIRKIFEIIQALPEMAFFSSDEEMDDYLQQIHPTLNATTKKPALEGSSTQLPTDETI